MFSFFGGGGTFQEEYKSYLEEGCAEDIEKATFDNIKVVARAMKKAGKLPLAIDGFRHALNKGAPDDKAEAAVQYNLANTLFEERLYDQAIQSYSDAVKTKGESGFPQAEYNQAVTICEMANDVKYIKRIGAFLQLKAMLDEVTCDEKGLDLMKSDHAIRNLINDLGEDDHAAVVNAVEGKAMELVLAAEGGAAKLPGLKEARAGTVWTKQLGIMTGADAKLLETASADSKDDDGTFKLALKYLLDTGRVDQKKIEKESLMYGYVAALDLVNAEGFKHLASLDDKLAVARKAVKEAGGSVQVAVMKKSIPHYENSVNQYKAMFQKDNSNKKVEEMLADAMYNHGVARKDIGEMLGAAGGKELTEAITCFRSYLEHDPYSSNAKRLQEVCEWRRGMIVSLTIEQFQEQVGAGGAPGK